MVCTIDFQELVAARNPFGTGFRPAHRALDTEASRLDTPSRMTRVKKILFAAFITSLTACGTNEILLRGSVEDAKTAQSAKKVAVVPDLTMTNTKAADALADLTREKIQKSGYQLTSSAEDADLVVVAFVARDDKTIAETAEGLIDNRLSHSLRDPRAGTTAELSTAFEQPVTTAPEKRFILSVKAYPRKAWLVDKNLPAPAWSVLAKGVPPRNFPGSYVQAMLDASAQYFAKDTGTKPLTIPLP